MSDHSTPVIILGAGAAGLAAAARLTQAGVPALLLEARDRIGGRVDTRRFDAAQAVCERGAEFIHGRPAEAFDLVHRHRLRTIEVFEDHALVVGGRFERGEMPWEEVQQLLEGLEQLGGPDRSFATYLDQFGRNYSNEVRELAIGFVEGFNAADQHRIGIRGLAEAQRASDEISGEESFRVVGGYSRVIEALRDDCAAGLVELRTGVMVDAVRWNTGAVEVGSEVGIWNSTAAIITLPLGVLQAPIGKNGAVWFSPELPEQKRRSLSRLFMGPVVKVILAFKERFWLQRHPQLSFFHSFDEPFPTWWTQAPEEPPLLTGWAGGPAAERLASLPDDEIVAKAIVSLERLLGHTALRPLLVAAEVANWQRDPLARGAYSYVGVDGVEAVAALARPVVDTLFFAGEATHAGMSGTVAGAIASGYRAAEELLTARGSHANTAPAN
ncbi:MAG TPA: NAD(P)/FAD-dependent oxidoreductase [Pirellulales bacterium]|jgi:monoamine oxidase|nr:NAD(P)/FAD-dependent oxidoreductase [Pirellulales bacterium]